MLFLTLASAVFIAAAPAVPVCPVNDAVTAAHISKAKSAMVSGDLSTARQQYRIAEVLGRDNGCLPVDAAQGLAQLFFSQARGNEAAAVLQNLANDAAKAGDYDLEARTLIHVAWLYVDSGERSSAKASVRRLYELARDNRVSSKTRLLLNQTLR